MPEKKPRQVSQFMRQATGQKPPPEPVEETPAEERPTIQPRQVSPPPREEKPGLLYHTKPSPELLKRSFDSRHLKQTVQIDVMLAGAWLALIEVKVGGNKTKMVNDMVRQAIEENQDLLAANEDWVRYYEDKIREQFHL